MSNTPPGWYPDPEPGVGERWWDGSKWTNQTRNGPAAVPPPPPPGGWARPVGSYSRKSNAGLSLGLSIVGIIGTSIMVVAIVAYVVLVGLVASSGNY